MTFPSIDRQVFIGGCSRSGTTLLGAMLGQHRLSITTPESHFKYSVMRKLRGELDGSYLPHTLDAVKKHWRFRIWGIDFDRDEVLGRSSDTSYAGLLASIVGLYASRLGRPDARIWIDHTPENTTYGITLAHLFPQSKFIHIVRDGRGVAASILPLDWGPNTISRAAHWWVESVSYGLALEMCLAANQIMRVHFEELISDPAETLRKICDFLQIDYDPQMVEATGFKVPDYTASQHKMIGQKVDAGRAVQWQNTLSSRQIELFEHETRDFLAYLGYLPVYGPSTRGATVVEHISEYLTEAYRIAVSNNIRWLRRLSTLWLSNRLRGASK